MIEPLDLPYAKAQLARIPEAIRPTIKRDYWERYKVGLGTVKHEGRAPANNFLREAADQLQDVPVYYLDSEERLREGAERRAESCKRIYKRAPDELTGVNQLKRYLKDESINEPDSQKLEPWLSRVFCPYWWLRQLRKSIARRVEQFALCSGYVHSRGQVYCSDFALDRRRNQRHRLRDYASSISLENEDGQQFELSELIEKSNANPAVRRAEMMTRIRGMEEVAKTLNHAAVFLTITAPSKYHPTSKKYGGYTPRDTQEYFNGQWSKIRAAWKRADIAPYGLRVVEPHQDSAPHWHILLFVKPEHQAELVRIGRRYAFEHDGTEKGAYKARYKVEFINRNKGSATAYIAKYVSKNIDGHELGLVKDGEEIVPLSAASAAERIDAWASIWGIRQFQFIGSAPVTIWRELRRLDDEQDAFEYAPAEMARRAADSGDWAVFTLRYIRAFTEGNPIELFDDGEERIGMYGDQLPPKKIGVKCGDDFALTRWHEWTLVSEQSEPRTRVNNCTDEKLNSAELLKISRKAQNLPPTNPEKMKKWHPEDYQPCEKHLLNYWLWSKAKQRKPFPIH